MTLKRGVTLGHYAIWSYDLVRDTLDRFTTEGDNFAPMGSPDGRALAPSCSLLKRLLADERVAVG